MPRTLVHYYRLERAIPERIANSAFGITEDAELMAFSKAEGIEYISAWQTLCKSEGCLTRVGPAGSDVLTTDTVHLSEQGARYLIDAISEQLALP